MADIEDINKNVLSWRKAVKTINNEISVFPEAEQCFRKIEKEFDATSPKPSNIIEYCNYLSTLNTSSNLNLVSAIETFVRISKWASTGDLNMFIQQLRSPVIEEGETAAVIRVQFKKWKKAYLKLQPEWKDYKVESDIFHKLLHILLESSPSSQAVLDLCDMLTKDCKEYRTVNPIFVENVELFMGILRKTVSNIKGLRNFMAIVKGDSLYATIQKDLLLYDNANQKPSFKITRIEFANTNADGNIITDFGKPLFNTIQYLRPRITLSCLSGLNQSVTLFIKIFAPDGTLDISSSSPQGFTYSGDIILSNEVIEFNGWGSPSGNSYQAGNWRYEIWVEGELMIKTTVAILPTEVVIKSMQFAGSINDKLAYDYGRKLYSDIHYLRIRINIEYPGRNEHAEDIYVKFITPSGKIDRGSSSPEGYSFAAKISKTGTVELDGWGNKTGNSYSETGTWTVELWSSNNKLLQKGTFIIYKKIIPTVFTISNLELANGDASLNILSDYGKPLYSDMVYMLPRVTYNATSGNAQTIKLGMKIYSPDGLLDRGSSSPSDYTHISDMTFNTGMQTVLIDSWGNTNGRHYTPGTWRIELWHDGKLYYKRNFLVKKRRKSSALLTICLVAIALFAAWAAYRFVYVPQKIDNEAERNYVFADILTLRTSKRSDIEYNKIGSLDYGTELITYNQAEGWSDVKYKDTKGHVASNYIMGKSDFIRLNGVWGNETAKELVSTAKCRRALVDFVNKDSLKTGREGWQLFTEAPDAKLQTIAYPALKNNISPHNSFAFILKNNKTNDRKLAIYSFNEEETPILVYQERAPKTGYISRITYTNKGYKVTYTSTAPSRKNQNAADVARAESTTTQTSTTSTTKSITIQNLSFASEVNKKDEVIATYPFISPQITCISNASGTKIFYIKIFNPQGKLLRDADSPTDYTRRWNVSLKSAGEKLILHPPVWTKESESYGVGSYIYEIWEEGTMIYKSYFKVVDSF